MFKIKILPLVAVVAGLGILAIVVQKTIEPAHAPEQAENVILSPLAEVSPSVAAEAIGTVQPSPAVSASSKPTDDNVVVKIKEFTMTSFYEMVDGKPKPQFSLGEIRVKKGDTVRINVTNTKGMHDFVIDEYAIAKGTPLNEKVVIDFVADKAGSFIYYCSMPNHRALGQWGTLIVE